MFGIVLSKGRDYEIGKRSTLMVVLFQPIIAVFYSLLIAN